MLLVLPRSLRLFPLTQTLPPTQVLPENVQGKCAALAKELANAKQNLRPWDIVATVETLKGKLERARVCVSCKTDGFDGLRLEIA